MFKDIKEQFPIFKNKTNGKELVYLDSANSSQKPQTVIDAVSNFIVMNLQMLVGEFIH